MNVSTPKEMWEEYKNSKKAASDGTRESAGSVSVLPKRLEGELGMLNLLSECRIRLDASQNVSLIADIEAVLKQND